MPAHPQATFPVFATVTALAVMNGVRKLVDAAVPMSTEVAEQALVAYVARSSTSDAVARAAVAAAGGWLGCVSTLFIRMRSKAQAAKVAGELPRPSVCHTLLEAAAVLNRARVALPTATEPAWKVG